MGLAFELAFVALRLADRGDLANAVLADKIVDLAKTGERDPERLCDGVLMTAAAQGIGPTRPSANAGLAGLFLDLVPVVEDCAQDLVGQCSPGAGRRR
jgi:hypothetical protein